MTILPWMPILDVLMDCRNSGWRRLWRSAPTSGINCFIISQMFFDDWWLKSFNMNISMIIRCVVCFCCAFNNLVHHIKLNPWNSCSTCNTYNHCLFFKMFFLCLVSFVKTLGYNPSNLRGGSTQAITRHSDLIKWQFILYLFSKF